MSTSFLGPSPFTASLPSCKQKSCEHSLLSRRTGWSPAPRLPLWVQDSAAPLGVARWSRASEPGERPLRGAGLLQQRERPRVAGPIRAGKCRSHLCAVTAAAQLRPRYEVQLLAVSVKGGDRLFVQLAEVGWGLRVDLTRP